MNIKKIVVSLLSVGLVAGIGVYLYTNNAQNSETRCGSSDTPCVLEDVNEDKFDEGIGLMLEAQTMIDEGSELSEVIDYIYTENEIAELHVGDEGIIFQPVGGPLLIVEAEQNEYSGQTEIMETDLNSKQTFNFQMTETALAQSEDTDKSVTGSDEGKEQREQKQALILAPYEWEFGSNDDGPLVRDILESNRNFAGNVEYKSNTTDGANNVTILDFVGWDEYEVVHISTHGILACRQAKDGEVEIVSGGDSSLCRTVLDTGFKFKNEAAYKEAYNKWKGIPGVGISKTKLFLSSDFFAISAGSKLKNTVVSFSACEMGIQSDMQSAISSMIEDGDFFYWTKTVNSGDAINAFRHLYTESVVKGININSVYEEMPGSLKTGLPSSFDVRFKDRDGSWSSQEIETTTDLIHVKVGEGQHVPEIITMINPETEERLGGGVIYDFVGQYGDGEPEKMNIDFELQGYSLGGLSENGITLSFDVNGENFINKIDIESEAASNPKIELGDGSHEKSVKVTITNLEIMPLQKNKSVLFEAYMNFENGAYSYHSEKVLTSVPDVRAYTNDGRLEAIYDNDTKSLRIEAEGNIAYMDENYSYAEVPGDGWYGTDLGVNGAAGMGNFGVPDLGNGLDFGSSASGSSAIYKFPVVDLSVKAQQAGFEASPYASEGQEIECDGGKCTRYNVNSPDGNGYVVFDINGRLKEFSTEGTSILYEYGDYSVNVPAATIINVPNLGGGFGNMGGMPDMSGIPDIPVNIPNF